MSPSRLTAVVPMTIAVIAVIAGTIACRTNPSDSTTAATLQRLEKVRLEALGRGDADALVPLFHPDLVVTLGAMERTGAQILDRTRAAAREGIVRNETAENVVVRRYGDVAITRGTALVREPDGSEGRSRFTNVWLRTGGQWRLIAGHVGAIVAEE